MVEIDIGKDEGEKKEKGDMDWWEDRTVGQKVLIVLGFVVLGVGLLFLFGWAVMLLWNWLMPDIFGLKRISYWQAWGLLALSTILFKGMGSSKEGGKSDRKRKKQLKRYMREGCAAEEGKERFETEAGGAGKPGEPTE